MSLSRGYRLPVKVERPRRPSGVAALGMLGVGGSLIISVGALLGIWSLMRISLAPSPALAVFALVLVAALVVLWINWGLLDLLRWAWWANLLLALIGTAGAGFGMRYAPLAGKLVHELQASAVAATIEAATRGALIGMVAINLVTLLYLLSVHTSFGVGVKDERPLWEKAHRH